MLLTTVALEGTDGPESVDPDPDEPDPALPDPDEPDPDEPDPDEPEPEPDPDPEPDELDWDPVEVALFTRPAEQAVKQKKERLKSPPKNCERR
jgi:hypothetical protein